jgi:hypothetical protein
MKITETIERDCCHPNKDLIPIKFRKVVYPSGPQDRYCIHCGRRWEYVRKAGEMDYGWEIVEGDR